MRGRDARRGFTLVELMVAIVLLTVIAISVSGAAQYTSRIMVRSSAELGLTQLLQDEVERLRTLPWDSIRSRRHTSRRGTAAWTVTDNGTHKQVTIVATHATPRTRLVDTLVAVRARR